MIWLLAAAVAAAPPVPCATPQTWADVVDPAPALPPPPDGLGERDAFGVPNVQTSAHFALRWGNADPPDQASRDRLLDAFELGWDVQLEQMGHTRPYGTGEYYFNVYVGDSGSGAPPGAGAGGYYTTDPDGWPMIVVARNTMYNPDYADITAVHEFYHAVQGATGRFNYRPDGPSAWFWEATATWASAVIYEDNPDYATFLAGYAFYPHKRLNFFDYPDTGALQEYYQYGAFVFPLHVSQQLDSWEPIRDVWEDEGTSDDPIEVMREKLADRGVDFNDVWLDHIARNATWDYPNGNIYRGAIAEWSWRDESSQQFTAALPAQGTNGVKTSTGALPLERYGAHMLRMNSPLNGEYTIVIDGDAEGDLGGDASWGATAVVTRLGGDAEYIPIEFDGTRGEISFDDLGDAGKLYIALGVWSDYTQTSWGSETFAYTYEVQFVRAPEPEPVPESGGGCGCATTGPAAGWLVLPLLLALVRRRR